MTTAQLISSIRLGAPFEVRRLATNRYEVWCLESTTICDTKAMYEIVKVVGISLLHLLTASHT